MPASDGKIQKRNFSVSTIAGGIFLEKIPWKLRGFGRFAFKYFPWPGIRRRTSDRWRVHNSKQRAFAYPRRVPFFFCFPRFEVKSRGFEIAGLRWVNFTEGKTDRMRKTSMAAYARHDERRYHFETVQIAQCTTSRRNTLRRAVSV